MQKWRIKDIARCERDHDQQSVDHIVNNCRMVAFTGGISDVQSAAYKAIAWIDNLKTKLKPCCSTHRKEDYIKIPSQEAMNQWNKMCKC